MIKKINLNSNLKLADDMAACSVLFDVALTETKKDKFTAGIMRTAKLLLLSGAVSLKNTSEAMSAFIQAVADDKKNNISIPTEELTELTASLIELRDNLQEVADVLEKGVINHGNLI